MEIFNLARTRFSELINDVRNSLISRFNQDNAVFNESSPLGQTLFVQQNLQQFALFYIEDSVTEGSVKQATRDANVLAIADEHGYRPSRSVAAIGEIRIKPKTSISTEIVGNTVYIPNNIRLKCSINSFDYVFDLPQDSLAIDITQTSAQYYINIAQGKIETTSAKGKGNPFDSITINHSKVHYIDNYRVKVYVNDKLCTNYDNILKSSPNEYACMIKSGTTGLDVFFGDSENYGYYPAYGEEIRVEYLLTNGYNGNIDSGDKSAVIFSFVDSGLDLASNDINLNDVFDIETTIIPSCGYNNEPMELTRLMLSKNVDRLITPNDYDLALRRTGMFSTVRVHRNEADPSMLDLFLVPDVNKLINKGATYFNVDESRFVLSDKKQEQILQYLTRQGSNAVRSDIRIISPKIRRYALNITIKAFKGLGFNDNLIKGEILNALSVYFLTYTRKDSIPKSDLIDIIKGVNGVDSASINIVGELNEKYKSENPNSDKMVGLDVFNDIIIGKDELPIIRGGWSDKNGKVFQTGIVNEGLGAVNIVISGYTSVN